MVSIGFFASAVLALITVLCYAAAILALGSASGLFRRFSPLQKLATCVAFAPMALSWAYGSALRLVPNHKPSTYFVLIVAISLPFVLWTLLRAFRSGGRFELAVADWRGWTERLSPILFVSVLVAMLMMVVGTNARVPIATNDPMEYFTVARAIFLNQRLNGIYPVLAENVAGGFYGPWTHPPGYVLIIAWLYICQGTAEFAGIAKLLNVYATASLALVVWAWSGGPFRASSIIAVLLVLHVPFLLWEAFDVHVDVFRIGMFTAIICMVPAWLAERNATTSSAFGFLVGLAIYVHSLGILFFGFFIGLLFVLQSGRLFDRLMQGVVVVVVAVLMLLPDLMANYSQYGYFVGDSVPLWRVESLNLMNFLNEVRGIGSLRDKIVNGVFAPITRRSELGWATVVFGVAAAVYLFVLAFQARDVRSFCRRLLKPTLINVLVLSMAAFVVLLALSVSLGSNVLIKSTRYSGTMSALAGIGSILMINRVLYALSNKIGWRWPSLNFLYLSVALLLSFSLLTTVRHESVERQQAFQVENSDDGNRAITCGSIPALALVGEINEALRASPGRRIKVLAFFPAGSAYYGKYPIVSYLDPQMLPAFLASTSAEAFDFLQKLGVTHVILPSYKMGEVENSIFARLLRDPSLFRVDRLIGGNKLLAATGQTSLFSSVQQSVDLTKVAATSLIALDSGGLVAQSGAALNCFQSITVGGVGEASILTVAGRMIITSSQKFEVDTSKKYRLSFDLRVPVGSPKANTWAGLATFDIDGVLQTAEPGTYRYGVLENFNVEPLSEWTRFSGVFEGVGNQSRNQFRAGTHTIAPVFLLNYYNPGTATTELRNVVIEQVK